MRAVMAFTAVLPLIATACATSGNAAQRAPTTVPAFIIERETRVCASVQVDADLGTAYARDGSDPNLSLAMAAALNRASPGGLGDYYMPDGSGEPRFFPVWRTSRYCQDKPENIFVVFHYRTRKSGGPFIVDYSIRQGLIKYDGTEDRNISKLIIDGTIKTTSIDDHTQVAILTDINDRVKIVWNFLRYRR
jgi:hypothetical protein